MHTLLWQDFSNWLIQYWLVAILALMVLVLAIRKGWVRSYTLWGFTIDLRDLWRRLWGRGGTVVLEVKYGKSAHYGAATELVREASDEIFLMQRSSTLLLGPEVSDPQKKEEAFFYGLWAKVYAGTKLLHIVNVDGIKWHKREKPKNFPAIADAIQKLLPRENDDCVYISGPGGKFPIKKVDPDDKGVVKGKEVKIDRQARVLVVRTRSGGYKAGIVLDLGWTQCYFVIQGPLLKNFAEYCHELYEDTDPLTWTDLENLRLVEKVR